VSPQKPKKIALVITTIAKPNIVLETYASECLKRGYHFIVIGDVSSPSDFFLEGCDYYDLNRQKTLGFKLVDRCPIRHYTRKNIGYLVALKSGAEIIIETDDDNLPMESFWATRKKKVNTAFLKQQGWVNIYRFFSEGHIWPRGFPLTELQKAVPMRPDLREDSVLCPIQQSLVHQNPDVDAVHRLVFEEAPSFTEQSPVALKENSWCPFNSQNTTWWKESFPLMYLPATSTFRMTDIWRSFVAQRIAWENDWAVLFSQPNMIQIRNPHDLLKDFKDELPGYLHNESLCSILESLNLKKGVDNIDRNLMKCYEKLVEIELLDSDELPLIRAWIEDFQKILFNSSR
jgi:hypothetical protein